MRFEVIRQTSLFAKPARRSKILRPLAPGETLIGDEVVGEWIKVTVSDFDLTGWVRAQDCRRIPEPVTARELKVLIKDLAAKRRKAVVTPTTVTLKHLAAALSEEHELSKKSSEAILNDLVGRITKHLKKGERIRIVGLGQVRKRAARMGRNPATGEAIRIKASKKVAFRAAKSSRDGGVSRSLLRKNKSDGAMRRPVTRFSGGDHRGAKKMMRSAPKPVPHIQRRPPAKKTRPVPAPAAVADVVDVSVFGPQSLRAGGECLVQVFLHTLAQQVAVAARARETDAASARRGANTLATEIARGTRVQIVFEGRGLGVDQAMQELTWRGEPAACQFTVSAPADAAGQAFHPRILVLLNSAPVGTVTFALPATTTDAPAATTVIRGDKAWPYSYAFLSYSSLDRVEVVKRAEGIRAVGVDFFLDFVKLEPGDHWVPQIDQEIDRCDLFLLFWSPNASASPWVMKEVDRALARQKSSDDELPHIRPLIIEPRPAPLPPVSLTGLHFNDSMDYLLAGVEAEAQARKPPA